MSEESIYLLTKNFFESKAACKEALSELPAGVEIKIVLEERLACALSYENGQVIFEQREAKNPDIAFFVSSEAVRRLMEHPGDNLADLGIEITREVFTGEVKIKVLNGIFSILTNGYLNIIKKAGPDFMTFLSQHGFSKIDKIISAIKGLRG